jgi:hypothetical protein
METTFLREHFLSGALITDPNGQQGKAQRSMEWCDVPFSVLPDIPGMLVGEEQQFLYWYARDKYTGAGEIVELGAFLGLSSSTLAAGLAANPRCTDKRARIHSFDRFEYDKSFYAAYLDEPLAEGADTLPIVRRNLGPHADYVAAVKGDIAATRWGSPIELLFVDFTQTWQQHDAVARIFYPHLQIGSYLAHQDYLHVVCYWLHVWMEFYSNYFRCVSPHIRNATAVWELVKPLPPEAFSVSLASMLRINEILSLMDRSFARYAGRGEPVYDVLLQCARVRFLLHAYGPAAARGEAAKLPPIHPAVDQLRDEVERWARQSPSDYEGRHYEGFFRA